MFIRTNVCLTAHVVSNISSRHVLNASVFAEFADIF